MKILLTNPAAIGDLILSTSVLAPLKRAMPNCYIGFLAGSWAKEVVEEHVHIDQIHVFDHWQHNRSALSKRAKKRHQQATKKMALQQIKEAKYDVALDLYSYYQQNAAHIPFEAAIPTRVGYWQSRQPYYYNQTLFWQALGLHVVENHRTMLRELGMTEHDLMSCVPTLHYKTSLNCVKHQRLPQNYLLIHMGTGAVNQREWPTSCWKELVVRIDRLNIAMVFIGKGKREAMRIIEVADGLKNAHNFCDEFSFKQLLPVVQRAHFVLGLESMSAHLTAAFSRPGFFIYGTYCEQDWSPYHPHCHFIRPDFRYFTKGGSDLITPKRPIETISVDEVWQRLELLLKINFVL